MCFPEIYPNGLGRWDKYVDLLEEASHKTPWHSKSPKVEKNSIFSSTCIRHLVEFNRGYCPS